MSICKRKNKKGIVYIIDYYDDNGIRHRETIRGNRKLAEQALSVRKTEIAQDKFDIQNKRKSITFGKLAKEYIEYAKVNKKSWYSDKKRLKKPLQFFENMKLKSITPLHLEKYKQRRVKEVKPSTVNRDLALMKFMFSLAVKWGYTKSNPVKEISLFKENNKRFRYLLEDEIHRLIECSPLQLKPVVITALNTGMRKGNILGLKWSDIDFSNNLILLDDSKGGNARQIPINDYLRGILLDLKNNNSSDYVFLNKLGKPYRDVSVAFKRACKKARIIEFCFHDLRHTFASHLAMANIPILTIQRLMGHKTIQMTMRYAHLSEEYKHQAVDILQKRLFNSHNLDTKGKVENPLNLENH